MSVPVMGLRKATDCGNQQPRSLSVALLKPITGTDMLKSSIHALEKAVTDIDNAYGTCADSRATMNVASGQGQIGEIIACATEA